MSDNWQKAYGKLQEFIAANPSIEISSNIVTIPGDVRSEFYRLFDNVKIIFIREKFQNLLGEAQVLSRYYNKIKQEVVELLNLDNISTAPTFNNFLSEPNDYLMKEIFRPLFDLIQGKITIESFEQQASKLIYNSYGEQYRSGYRWWVHLSVLKLLNPDKGLSVNAPPVEWNSEGPTPEAIGMPKAVPRPEDAKQLSFEHEAQPSFLVPDIIIRSSRINKYVAINSATGIPLWKASNAGKSREWYGLDNVAAILPNLTIYLSDKPKELSLVADRSIVARPDLIVECVYQNGLYVEGALEKVKLQHKTFKPRFGTYIVSREPVPDQAYKLMPKQASEEVPQEPEKQDAGIHVITVGFNRSRLRPIISALVGRKRRTLAT